MAEQAASLLPTAREKKYDRQLRLWAASGQAALEDAHVLCLNSGSGVTGVEALKNLILPGIGSYTIQDSAIVTEADLGLNFFLDRHSLASFRADCTAKLLNELNPSVHGTAIAEPIETWLAQENILNPYTLIIVTSPIKTQSLAIVTAHAKQHNVPLVFVHSVGYRSLFSLALPPAFPIVDTHPDPETTLDLRLLNPWPELAHLVYQKTANLDSLSAHDLAHVPYALLLLCLLEQWRASHHAQPPSTFKEKAEFRTMVRNAGPPGEENFEEACAAVLKTVRPADIPRSVLDVLTCSEAQNLHARAASFWYIANAINVFTETHGQLPLPGTLPDMKAVSSDYIALQTIYKDKARKDCAEVTATVRALEAKHGRPADLAISPSEIDAFCKNAAHIKLLRGSYSAIDQLQTPLQWTRETAKTALDSINVTPVPLVNYIGFLAYHVFVNTHDADGFGATPRMPGVNDDDVESDALKLVETAHAILDCIIKAAGSFMPDSQYSEIKTSIQSACQELARSAGAELHNIAALTGGLVAQEVIKVITKQYVPVDNVCIFDGIHTKIEVMRL